MRKNGCLRVYNEYMRKLVICVVAGICALLVLPDSTHAFTITSPDVTVSATIGGPPVTPPPKITPPPKEPTRFSIFGYSSPGAKVHIDNPGMYMDTTADAEGYFEFGSFFSRLLIEDICLVAQDEAGRVSPPVCIPPVPSSDSDAIGPVIMPPTLSLTGDSFYSGDEVSLTGQTTPNTEVNLSLFTDETKSGLTTLRDSEAPVERRLYAAISLAAGRLNPFRQVYAASLPKQTIKVDKKGNFTLKLGSEDPQYYRTFGQTVLEKAFSPKSVTLNFDIFPGWFVIMKFILGFLGGLRSRILEIVMFAQVAGLAWYLMHRFTHPHRLSRLRALALREHPLPMITEHELVSLRHPEDSRDP